jgi:hypothetical protein
MHNSLCHVGRREDGSRRGRCAPQTDPARNGGAGSARSASNAPVLGLLLLLGASG